MSKRVAGSGPQTPRVEIEKQSETLLPCCALCVSVVSFRHSFGLPTTNSELVKPIAGSRVPQTHYLRLLSTSFADGSKHFSLTEHHLSLTHSFRFVTTQPASAMFLSYDYLPLVSTNAGAISTLLSTLWGKRSYA